MAWVVPAIEAVGAIASAIGASKQKSGAQSDAQDKLDDLRKQGRQDLLMEEGKAEGFQDPFRQQGLTAGGSLEKLSTQDPSEVINNILSKFRESPFQKYTQQQGISSIRNLEEAKGLLGTPGELQNISRFTEQQAGANQQNFLRDVLGVRGSNIGALQNIFGTGANVAENMGRGAIQTGSALSQLSESEMDALAKMSANSQACGLLGSLAGGLGGASIGAIMGGKKGGGGQASGSAVGFLKGL